MVANTIKSINYNQKSYQRLNLQMVAAINNDKKV